MCAKLWEFVVHVFPKIIFAFKMFYLINHQNHAKSSSYFTSHAGENKLYESFEGSKTGRISDVLLWAPKHEPPSVGPRTENIHSVNVDRGYQPENLTGPTDNHKGRWETTVVRMLTIGCRRWWWCVVILIIFSQPQTEISITFAAKILLIVFYWEEKILKSIFNGFPSRARYLNLNVLIYKIILYHKFLISGI